MIYLNNAATSFPKPESVIKAMTENLTSAPQSALRSNLADEEDLLTDLRRKLGTLFHIADYERIFFCSSATDAINRVLGGLRLSAVEVSRDNHNSVLRVVGNTRPLTPSNLEGESGYSADSETQVVSPSLGGGTGEAFPSLKGTEEALLIMPHCSNVTGEIHDINRVCQDAHAQGRLVMVDAAQSAGCIPIDVDGWEVDILVFTGHKSLFGPTGTGGYYVRRGIDLRPTQFGGTGRDSSVIKYEEGDWEYEVGTQNTVGLSGLRAGVDVVLERGVEFIYEELQQLTLCLIRSLQSIKKVTVYSPGGEHQGPVVSFNIENLKPSDVGYILQNAYGITVRTGLHCAPLIHEDLGTAPLGTVRASLSCLNTRSDIEALVGAVGNITSNL